MSAIATGVWLYGSVSRAGVLANQVSGWLASRAVGLVPGKDVEWSAPFAGDEFRGWLAAISTATGGMPKSWVVHLPVDRRRRRFNLLLLDHEHRPSAFAKFTMNPPSVLANAAMARLSDKPPDRSWTPIQLAAGELGDFSYLLTTAMPRGPHGPAKLGARDRRMILDELQDRLHGIATPPDVVVHGDFAPWNVRALSSGKVAVVDWEQATGGPIAADELWYLACSLSARAAGPQTITPKLSSYSRIDLVTAAHFWLEKLTHAEPPEIDSLVAPPKRLTDRAARIRRLLQSFG